MEGERFEVGEIAIGRNLVYDPACNGMECLILSPLISRTLCEWRSAQYVGLKLCYKVRWANGEISHQQPHELRKRPQPPDWEKLATPTDVPDYA